METTARIVARTSESSAKGMAVREAEPSPSRLWSGGRAFDLSSEAFAAIADPDVGVITVGYSLASPHNDGEDAVSWAKEQLIAEVGYGGQY